MNDYYCKLERVPEQEQIRVQASLAHEAAEKFAHMMWQDGEIPDREKCDEVVIVRMPNDLGGPAKFRVTTQTKVIYVGRRV